MGGTLEMTHATPMTRADKTHVLTLNPENRHQQTESKKQKKPESCDSGLVCAPAGIRTLDTLIKSQLL